MKINYNLSRVLKRYERLNVYILSTIAFLLVSNIEITAQTNYYVAVNGNDNNSGTLDQPFESWQKGIDVAQPGDTIYVRGGTYYADPSINDRFGAYMNYKSGNSEARICLFAYPGETPLLDASTLTNTARMNCGIYIKNSNFWHIKGLQVTGVSQQGRPAWVAGILIENGNNNIIEQCNSFENEGIGIQIREESEDNLLLNCDCSYNYDVENDGNNADGIQLCYIPFRAGDPRENILRGCRCWMNADDGYDLWGNEGRVVFDSCWAFTNGTHSGDGYGFKLGKTEEAREDGIYRRELTHCIAAENVKWNFNNSESDALVKIYNCTAYKSTNFCGFEFIQDNQIMGGEIKNCISYNNHYTDNLGDDIFQENNDWNLSEVVVSDEDFISLDVSLLLAERKEDGSLPDTDYLRPADGSDLIDAGVRTGLGFSGDAPDLGAVEHYGTVGMDQKYNKEQCIKVYPNPSNNKKITIDLRMVDLSEEASIDVYDRSGKTVFQKQFAYSSISGINQISVDLSELGAGIYFLRYRDKLNDHCCKFIMSN